MRHDSHEPTPVLDGEPGAPRGRAPLVGEPDRYQVGAEVARGGLGRVLRAHDRRLDREVALKRTLVAGPRAAERFEHEARVTARLQHPSIVPVYDLGSLPDGEPFYSMKLVTGVSLEQAIAAAGSLAARMALLPGIIAVADAIAYAHSQRIVHRDLKPANVLVGAYGETIVIDWGMARELDAAEPAAVVVGTPAYAPPEQAEGRPADERADVYALGAMLYHLLAGAPPHRGRDFAAVLAAPPRALAEAAPGAPPELCAIVERAMARRPEERYPSAGELAEDLRRFQTGRLVSAHAYSTVELVRRWLARHRAAVTVAAALLAALAVTAAVSVARIVRATRIAERERAAAVSERRLADARRLQVEERSNAQKLLQGRALLEADPTSALAWLKAWSPRAAQMPAALRLAADAESRGVAESVHGCPGSGRFPRPAQDVLFFGGQLAFTCPDGVHLGSGAVLHPPGGVAEDLEADPRRGWLATHDLSGQVVLWARAGATLAPHALGEASAGMVALASGELVTVDPAGRFARWRVDAQGGATRLAATPPGRDTLVAAGGDALILRHPDGSFVAWNPVTDARVELGAAARLEVSRDGRHALTEDAHGRLRRRALAPDAGPDVDLGVVHDALALAISPHGAHVAVADAEHVITLVERDGRRRRLGRMAGTRLVMAFSADERLLAVGALAGELTVFELGSGRARALRGHTRRILQLVWADDAPRLASLAEDEGVRAWRLGGDDGRALGGAMPLAIAYSPDGARLAAAGNDGVVRLWEVATGALHELRTRAASATAVAWSPDGAWLASAGEGDVARIWRVADAAPLAALGTAEAVTVAWSPDGGLVATGGPDGVVRLWDGRGGAVAELRGHDEAVLVLAFARDGHTLASAGAGHEVILWDVTTRRERRRLGGHAAQVVDVAFSPDGRQLATSGGDGTVRLFGLDLVPDAAPRVLARLDDFAYDVTFSPDGTRLAYSGWEGSVGVVELATSATRVFTGHAGRVYELAFSPDGRHLASAGADQTVRLWELTTGAARVLRLDDGAVRRVAFSPDGRTLATGDQNGGVKLWNEPTRGLPPTDPAGFAAWLGSATAVIVGPDDRLLTL